MDLLERFARGDLDAFEAVFRQFQDDVRGWILRIVRNKSDAEDLTLEAFWFPYGLLSLLLSVPSLPYLRTGVNR